MAWTEPVMTFVANAVLTAAQLNTHLRDNLEFLKENILLEAPTELTIVAGSVTITKSYHTIDTVGGAAASSDLDAIAFTGDANGRIVYLRAEHIDRTVVLKASAHLIIGADISLDNTDKHVALICDGTNWHLLYTARDVVFMANAFQYPGTDWIPQLEGAGLAASLVTKKVWLPLNFLKLGDSIISYTLNGDATEAIALTLDCKLVSVNLADPIGTTDVPGGDIVPVVATGNFSVTATLTALEVVTTANQYVLEILGTTGAGDTITVMGAEVLVRRLV